MKIVNFQTGEKLGSGGSWEAVRLSRRDGLALISMILPPGGVVDSHAVEEVFYLYVVRGSVHFHSGGESRALRPGDLAVDEPGSLHGIENRGEEEAVLLLMRQSVT
ncbi:MAG TPA: cupin domain-containing protein [Candidatus Mcinerneyibacteriales bacterium]|jgi:quercetin dioxygenase-like cupin family protein|nr:cupin domain-containing protein [Candidatus Mcinerneyibacteriales bacterium]HPE19717.1 cupin domain-containing protein [Candidatus Mcinerneyibacteriales bacterium]HPJ69818.1 cupin domain-containing protein [Candidatus Mcinerneyibacteriales bacterium]